MNHYEPDETALKAILPDQAAIYGIITRLRDLGLPLPSGTVEAIEPDQAQRLRNPRA